MNNTNTLPAEVLIQRRELLNAADAASKAYQAACAPLRDSMGIVGKAGKEATAAEYKAWMEAEQALTVFYYLYSPKTYKREFAAESKAYRGRA